MIKKTLSLWFLTICSFCLLSGQIKKAPVMGWSSWNQFRVNINEELIKQHADIMVTSGLFDAGYRFINIDDGYFEGRDQAGNLLSDPVKFPNGMGALASYIHSKGLKAGIYTDAGKNTCGSIWDNDKKGIGVGLYGYLIQDMNRFLKEWKYDFIKVDWCGGEKMNLNTEEEYTKIIRSAKGVNPDVIFNVCRWEFPGKWAISIADSWRISGDISPEFKSILRIIDINRDLYPYASVGHYNDMDMLQVGRGMNYDEDKSHFSMWCMLNSPLLAGNDLRSMSKETLEILTNKELIALNQDRLFQQARSIYKDGSVEVWKKNLYSPKGKSMAIALLNRGDQKADIVLDTKALSIPENAMVRDLWTHRNLKKSEMQTFTIPAHGIIVLKIEK